MKTKLSDNMSDIEYLAGLGFEKVSVNESDFNELRTGLRSRTGSVRGGSRYLTFITFITGIFVGISVFFIVYTPAPSVIAYSPESNLNENNRSNQKIIVNRDTVNFVNENFIRKSRVIKSNSDPLTQLKAEVYVDSASEIPSIPIDISKLEIENVKEPEIKYIANSPVVFIHDMKVTDYSTLYFRRNRFISINAPEGVSAAYSNREDYNNDKNILEPVVNYFLHEAIAEAMLCFKNKDYSACISKLNVVSGFSGKDINCSFYYGLCYYYRKNYGEALKNFEDCISNPNNTFLQEAEYYKARCLLSLGEKEKAVKLFTKIAADGGFYSEKAKLFLQ